MIHAISLRLHLLYMHSMVGECGACDGPGRVHQSMQCMFSMESEEESRPKTSFSFPAVNLNLFNCIFTDLWCFKVSIFSNFYMFVSIRNFTYSSSLM